jgi:hypothetical protein
MVRLFLTVGSHQGVMVRLFLTVGSHQYAMVRLFLTVGSHQGVMVRLDPIGKKNLNITPWCYHVSEEQPTYYTLV